MMWRVLAIGLFLCSTGFSTVQLQVPPAARASLHFNPQAATDAWLATVAEPARRQSDAYFEGGCWLILWDFLLTATVMIILLETGFSGQLRNRAARMTTAFWPQAYVYWIGFAVTTALLFFPLTAYEGFFREHAYGLSNQSFLSWLRDQVIAFAVIVSFGGLAVATIAVLIKRLRRSWHYWAALVALSFAVFTAAFAPVFLAPLFNKYTPLPDSALKTKILSLARANGVPAREVFEVDASLQSKRVSANVSGLFGTDRITLNDNLLARCSPEGVLSVMGHEMGHYVMHHILDAMVVSAIFFYAMFGFLRWALEHAIAWRGTRWKIADPGDIAALPLAVLLLSCFAFLTTPLTNSFTRMQEYEADIFGLDAARQPDGEAEVDLLLGEYRKLDPSPLEEFLFFDHPSGRSRIYAAMRWKAENLPVTGAPTNQ